MLLRSPVTRNLCSFILRTGTVLKNEPISNRRLLSTLSNQLVVSNQSLKPSPEILHNYQPSREYAARKGTRARKAAKKVKKVEVKREFVFQHLRKLARMEYVKQRPEDESKLEVPIDDVYFMAGYKSVIHSFDEALQLLREVHHPTMYNVPNAPLYLRVNVDLKYPNRATKCMDGWRSVIEMKSPFLLQGMTQPTVIAFCIEDLDYIENVKKESGAEVVGGKELIRSIQAGELNADAFEYAVAHPGIVNDLTTIRGLIKKKFPNVRNKTVSTDLVSEIRRLKSGIKVQLTKNDREPDFGYIETPIGTLDMDGLKDNFHSIIMDTIPRRVGNKSVEDFVLGCVLKTPGNGTEEFKVDLKPLFEEYERQREEIAKAKAAQREED